MAFSHKLTPHNVSYQERPGTGPIIVLLHGIGSNSASFEPLLAHTPPHFRIIAWNAPGYDNSDPLPHTWPTASNYAEKLSEFLDDLAVEKITLIGHSLGTLIAAAFAQNHPHRLKHLILASCANGYGVPVNGEMPASVAKRITDLVHLGPKQFAETRAARLIHNPDQHPKMVETVRHNMAAINAPGYAQAVRMLASGNLPETLQNVSIKPNFITGAQDLITPPERTATAAQAWADHHGTQPEVTMIDDAGHAVYIQQPKAFAKEILNQFEPETTGGSHGG